MELRELKDLLDLLRASGATHYKDGPLELTLGAAPVQPEAGKEITQAEKATELDKDFARMPEGYQKMFSVEAKGQA